MSTLPYDPQDVLDLESSVVLQCHLTNDVRLIFREDVAQQLYSAWQQDHLDTRIVLYAVSVIFHGMLRLQGLLRHHDFDDVFQDITLQLMSKLATYNPKRSSLHTWVTMVTHYAILELARSRRKAAAQHQQITPDDPEVPTSDDATYELNDLLRYLGQLADEEGDTGGRIITAITEIVMSETVNVQKQCHLVDLVMARAKLPRKIVEPYFHRLLNAYLAGSACA